MAAEPGERASPGLALLSLVLALGLSAWTTVMPRWLSRSDGTADHWAVLLVAWAISAGFVRGLGFIPGHPVVRYLLSGLASLLALGLALGRLFFSSSLVSVVLSRMP